MKANKYVTKIEPSNRTVSTGCVTTDSIVTYGELTKQISSKYVLRIFSLLLQVYTNFNNSSNIYKTNKNKGSNCNCFQYRAYSSETNLIIVVAMLFGRRAVE